MIPFGPTNLGTRMFQMMPTQGVPLSTSRNINEWSTPDLKTSTHARAGNFVSKTCLKYKIRDHPFMSSPAKVKRALMSVASPATSTSVSSALLCGGAASAAQHGRSTASSALPVTIVDTEAVLTVKEALKGGPSFVVLATARLRRVDKVSIKLHASLRSCP